MAFYIIKSILLRAKKENTVGKAGNGI